MIRNHLTSLFLSLIYGSSSTIDPIRASLESDSAKWFRGVWIAGIIVALGCVLEAWEVAFDIKNWRRHRKGLKPLPDNPGSWRYPLAALGLLLVVGGIVGETVFEVLDSNVESALRSHASDITSDAEVKAGTANERAQKLESANLSLQDKVTKALTEEASLEHDIVLAKRQTADAEKRLADETARTTRLEDQSSWRTVTPEQAKAIKDFLSPLLFNKSPFRGIRIGFTYMSGDAEAGEYAEELKDALHSALDGFGVEFNEPSSLTLFGNGATAARCISTGQ